MSEEAAFCFGLHDSEEVIAKLIWGTELERFDDELGLASWFPPLVLYLVLRAAYILRGTD